MVSKVENVDPKVPKEAETKRDGVINPQNYNFSQFYKENFDALIYIYTIIWDKTIKLTDWFLKFSLYCVILDYIDYISLY